MKFFKMQSFGNDFILIVNPEHRLSFYQKRASRWCHVKTGIGADGLLIVTISTQKIAKMQIINADGSLAAMCGNGLRCVAQFLAQKYSSRNEFTILTDAGRFTAAVKRRGQKITQLDVAMPQPQITSIDLIIPDDLKKRLGEKCRFLFVQVGVPHLVIFTPNVTVANATLCGEFFQKHQLFTHGINIDLAHYQAEQLEVITYERGVGITHACGTGAVATAASVWHCQLSTHPYLTINFVLSRTQVVVLWHNERYYLAGEPAQLVFHGELES